MKVENYTNQVSQIQRSIQPRPPIQPVQEKGTPRQSFSTELARKNLKPADVLSNDEMTMLKSLFNSETKTETPEQSPGYHLNRKKTPVTRLGTIIDIKV